MTINAGELEDLAGDVWAISPELYRWIRDRFEPNRRLLVFGNGRGTRILAKHYRVVCVEHDPAFMDAEGYEALLWAPLVGGTYDASVLQSLEERGPFDLVVIDGPPGHLCDRGLLVEHFASFWRRGTRVAIDDTNRPREARMVEMVRSRFPCMSETVTSRDRETVVLWPCNHFLNEIADSTVVISLRSRPDRRRHIDAHFADLGIHFHYLDAIRPSPDDVSWSEMRYMEAYGFLENLRSDYILGAVGCKRSAIAALEEFVDSSETTRLIVQDDCEWQPEGEAIIRRAWQELPDDWDMLYFSASNRQPPSPVSAHLTRLRGARHCTAILFRKRRARELLDGLKRCSTELDVYMEKAHRGLNAYCVAPMVARQMVNRSDIVGGVIDQAPR